MRALILIAGAIALAACSNNDQHDNTTNVGETLTAENIVSNDVTAIDAVTGDAANMAADSDLNSIANAPADQGNANAFPKAKPQTVTPSGSSAPPPSQAASNSIANATGNSD